MDAEERAEGEGELADEEVAVVAFVVDLGFEGLEFVEFEEGGEFVEEGGGAALRGDFGFFDCYPIGLLGELCIRGKFVRGFL